MIDWFTIGAQVLNFLVLIWLMKRFLYQPILHAIDEREKRIAQELSDADTIRNEAQKERDEFQQKNAEFDEQRSALMSKATEEVKGEREQLLAEARNAANTLSANRGESLKREQCELAEEICRRTQNEVFAIARKTLTELADVDLEQRISHVFTRRLRELNNESKNSIEVAQKSSSEPAILRSAFDLPDEARFAIQKALHEIFSENFSVRFETAPHLVGGIELSANGQKVAWSIADYITTLEEKVGELLEMKTS